MHISNIQMEAVQYNKVLKDDLLEDFEFVDDEGVLEIDILKSPVQEGSQKVNPGFGLFSTLCTAAEQQGLVVSGPVTTLASTAIGAVTGSLLGGPSGLAIGLITGAVLAYRVSPKRSKAPDSKSTKTSIRQIFSQMTLQEKKDLLKELLSCLKQSNVRCLILEILKNEGIRSMAMDVLSSFLMKRMGISLVKST